MTTAPIDLSICICTFRRPALLQKLLEALAAQDRAGRTIEIVVADNDPENSAATAIAQAASQLPVPVRGLHVKTPNIALARNATVQAAQGAWVLFVDDDEAPDPGWIARLLAAQEKYSADAVFGPVVPRYSAQTPVWMQRAGFFDRPRHPTGTRIDTRDARTGNVLVRRATLMQIEGPFDAAFGRTGGSDTILFGHLLARGAALVWCDEATVQEDVPPDRATLGWILRRAFRGGQTYLRSELESRTGYSRLARAAGLGLRAALQLVIAALAALACLPFSRPAAARWLRTACAQLGKLGAIVGYQYQEYGR